MVEVSEEVKCEFLLSLVAAKAIHGPCKSLCYFPKGSHVPHTQWTKTATLHTLLGKDDPLSAKTGKPISRVCISKRTLEKSHPIIFSHMHYFREKVCQIAILDPLH